jgi:hypothetical protein
MSLTQGYQQAGAQAAALDSQMERMADKPAVSAIAAVGGTNNAADYGNNSIQGVPGYYHSQDRPADTRMMYRQAAAAGPASASFDPRMDALGASDKKALQNFKVSLTDQDVAFFEKRRQEEQALEFDTWLGTVVNLSDPGESRYLQQIMPTLWTRRERFLEDQIKVEARAAMIRLRGPKNEEDYKFLFAIDKGYIHLPEVPAFSNAVARTSFKRGIFSVLGMNNAGQIGTTARAHGRYAPAAFAPEQGNRAGVMERLSAIWPQNP